jgi:hypothetical protein
MKEARAQAAGGAKRAERAGGGARANAFRVDGGRAMTMSGQPAPLNAFMREARTRRPEHDLLQVT